MHVTGIIAEYNPFHNGHAYQIERIHAQYPDSAIIAVMSGSFTQRGEAAIFDKWTRAKLAVLGGCDLVLELPFVFSCRSAQDFARGGVTLLQRLDIVDTLAFGAESPDLSALRDLALRMDSEATQNALQRKIKNGLSYASALTAALADADVSLLSRPNNILALEYLRSLHRLSSSIEPLLIARRGADYHDKDITAPNASASAIRQALYQQQGLVSLQNALPARVYEEVKKADFQHFPDMNALFLLLRYELLQMPLTTLQTFYNINEGIEHRILAAAQQASDYENFIHAVTTKRYPASRIRRTLIYLLLYLQQKEVHVFDAAGPLYARLLAVSPKGRTLLPKIKQQASVPLVSKVGVYCTQKDQRLDRQDLSLLSQMLRYDTLATNLRNLALAPVFGKNDWQVSPLFL